MGSQMMSGVANDSNWVGYKDPNIPFTFPISLDFRRTKIREMNCLKDIFKFKMTTN